MAAFKAISQDAAGVAAFPRTGWRFLKKYDKKGTAGHMAQKAICLFSLELFFNPLLSYWTRNTTSNWFAMNEDNGLAV